MRSLVQNASTISCTGKSRISRFISAFLAVLAVTAGEVRLHHYLYPEQMKIQC
jgi:hypothetical protein